MNLVCPQCGTTNRVPQARLQDQPVCGRCGAEVLPSAPVVMTDATLPPYIAGPEVRFAKVDTDANPRLSGTYGIRSIPTLILYRDGQELARQSGAMGSGDLVRWVQSKLVTKA